MEPFQGVAVEVISNSRTLPIYDDPGVSGASQSLHENICQRYMQCTTGAEFSVIVKLNKDFNPRLLGAEGLIRILLKIDGVSSQRKI